jgi:ferredoxin
MQGKSTISQKRKPMKIIVDQSKCTGRRNCIAMAPGVFDLNDEFKAFVADPNGDSEEDIFKAARLCPTLAIILEDEKTGERIYPKDESENK